MCLYNYFHVFLNIFHWLLRRDNQELRHLFTCALRVLSRLEFICVQFSALDTICKERPQDMVMIHVRKTNTYAYELTPHWKGFRTWVQKSSFTGEKALAHLRRDCGFSRRQRVSLQTQLAVFAGGKPAFITALMTPTDWGDRMNLSYCSENLCIFVVATWKLKIRFFS